MIRNHSHLNDGRLPERFWSKVAPEPNTGCWLWTASTCGFAPHEYGQYWEGGRFRKAHIVAYEALVGAVPEGLELDHVKARGCIGPLCCNPAHLEPVTHAENVRRGDATWVAGLRQRGKTHCPRGHAYDEANTKVTRTKIGSGRACRACDRNRARAKRAVARGAL